MSKSAPQRSADRVRRRLLLRQDRTYGGHRETDAIDPNRTWRNCSLDHLVGAGEQDGRNSETERGGKAAAARSFGQSCETQALRKSPEIFRFAKRSLCFAQGRYPQARID